MKVLPLLFLGVIYTQPAWADKPAYCAAYARDFADARSREKPMWQHKYDIALQACLGKPLGGTAVETPRAGCPCRDC